MKKYISPLMSLVREECSAAYKELYEQEDPFEKNINEYLATATEEQITLSLCGGKLAEKLQGEWQERSINVTLMIEVYKQKLLKDIAQLQKGNPPKGLLHDENRGFCYTFVQFPDNKYPKFIVLYTEKNEIEMQDAEATSNGSFQGTFNGWLVVRLKCLENKKFPELMDFVKILQGNFDSRLEHEINHTLKYADIGILPEKSSNQMTRDEYYNSEYEHEAYGTAILNKIKFLDREILLKEANKYRQETKNELDHTFVDGIIKFVLDNSTDEFKKEHQEYIESLNDKNKRDLYNSICELIQEKNI